MDEISDCQSGKDVQETMQEHIRVLYGEEFDDSPVSRMTALCVKLLNIN